jgi:hypothetical protein
MLSLLVLISIAQYLRVSASGPTSPPARSSTADMAAAASHHSSEGTPQLGPAGLGTLSLIAAEAKWEPFGLPFLPHGEHTGRQLTCRRSNRGVSLTAWLFQTLGLLPPVFRISLQASRSALLGWRILVDHLRPLVRRKSL